MVSPDRAVFAPRMLAATAFGLIDGIADRFQPDTAALPWERRAVARRPDRRVGGAAHTHRWRCRCRWSGQRPRPGWASGVMPTPTMTKSAGSSRPSFSRAAVTWPSPRRRSSAGVFHDLDAMATCRARTWSEVSGRGDALQDARRHFQHGDIQTQFRGHGGGLQPDIAAADDDDPATGDKFGAHRIDIGQGAHGVDAAQIATDGGRQAAGGGAGGQRKMVIGQRFRRQP